MIYNNYSVTINDYYVFRNYSLTDMNAKVVQRIVYCYCFQQHCFRSLLFVVIIPVGVAVAMVTDVLASRRIRRHEEVAR